MHILQSFSDLCTHKHSQTPKLSVWVQFTKQACLHACTKNSPLKLREDVLAHACFNNCHCSTSVRNASGNGTCHCVSDKSKFVENGAECCFSHEPKLIGSFAWERSDSQAFFFFRGGGLVWNDFCARSFELT